MKKISAFTLSEVLITLGIIGIIAALTLPNLIANYQKQVTVNRLKKSYSTVTQALTTSISENGEFSEWDIAEESVDWSKYKEKLSNLVKQNIIPYLKVIKDCEDNKCPNAPAGKYKNGTVMRWHGDHTHYVIYLADGSRVLFYMDNGTGIDGITKLSNLAFIIDINGDTKPNIVGRDIFYMYFYSNTTKMNMYGTQYTRDTMHANCKSNGKFCGGLIQSDGWEIKDDYPW